MAELVGRERELEVVIAALDASLGGQPQAVLLEGDAGIGKSSLLAAAAQAASCRGFSVLSGTADEVDRRPLALAVDALDLRILGEDATVAVALDALERASTNQPIALLLDDVHWADDESLAFLAAACDHLAGLPLAVVGAYRPAPRPPALESAIRNMLERGAAHYRVEPLLPSEATTLANSIAGDSVGTRLAQAVRSAAGNPFLVVELARAVADGTLDLDQADQTLPSPLRAAVLTRFETLAGDAVEEVRAASILGSHVVIDDVAALTARAAPAALRALAPAVDSGILVDRGGRLEFAHDLVQQAIYEAIPVWMRRTLHREAARLVAARGGRPDLLAYHERRAADGPNRESYDRVMAAYNATRTRSAGYPLNATSLVELAVELAPDTESYDAAVAPLVNHLYRLGRSHEIEEMAAPVVARATDPQLFAEAQYGIGSAQVELGRLQESRASFASIVDRDGVDDSLRIWAEVCVANCDIALGLVDEGVERARRAAAEAEVVGRDTPHILSSAGHAWLGISQALANTGDVRGAVNAGRRAADVDWRAYGYRNGAFVSNAFGTALSIADEHEEALAVLQRALQSAEAGGLAMVVSRYHAAIAVEQYRAGLLDEAFASAEAGVAACEQTGIPRGYYTCMGIAALAQLHQDDLVAAKELVESAFVGLDDKPLEVGLEWVLWARIKLEGRGAWSVWNMLQHLALTPSWRPIAPDLVRLAIERGDGDIAREITERIAPLATQGGSSAVAARRCRALLASDAAELLDIARSYPASRPLEAAAAAEDAAAAAAASDLQSARELLRSAQDVYRRLGAVRDETRVDDALRELGAQRRRNPRSARPVSGWEALTPAEVDVVNLVAEGLTNREVGERLFVARSTVQTHLLHVFAKLGVTSRAQLAGMVARRATRSAAASSDRHVS